MENPEHQNIYCKELKSGFEHCINKTLISVEVWQNSAGEGNADTKILKFDDGTFLVFHPDFDYLDDNGYGSERADNAFINFRTHVSKPEAVKLGLYDRKKFETEKQKYETFLRVEDEKRLKLVMEKKLHQQTAIKEKREKELIRTLEELRKSPELLEKAKEVLLSK